MQHQLEHTFQPGAELQGAEAQRWQATLALKNNLRERLTRHVVLQQEMLHHLDALVSSEVSKQPQDAAAGAAPPPAGATTQPPESTPPPPGETVLQPSSSSGKLEPAAG